MLKEKAIQFTNINVIYEKLDHRLIDSKRINDLQKLEKDNYGTTFVESYSPPVKRLVLPQSRVTIAITGNQVVINDDSKKNPKKSALIKMYLRNVVNLLKNFQSSKYGFNYRLTFRLSDTKKDEKILSQEFLKLSTDNPLSVGGRVLFEDGKVRQDLRVERVGESDYVATLNAHYEKPLLGRDEGLHKAVDRLQKEYEKNYEKLEKMVGKL